MRAHSRQQHHPQDQQLAPTATAPGQHLAPATPTPRPTIRPSDATPQANTSPQRRQPPGQRFASATPTPRPTIRPSDASPQANTSPQRHQPSGQRFAPATPAPRPTIRSNGVSRWASSVHSSSERSALPQEEWSGREDLNFRPLQPHCSALPDCATPRPEWAKTLVPDSGGVNRGHGSFDALGDPRYEGGHGSAPSTPASGSHPRSAQASDVDEGHGARQLGLGHVVALGWH